MTRPSKQKVRLKQFGSSIFRRVVVTMFLVAVGSNYATADENLTAEEQQALLEHNMELVRAEIEEDFTYFGSHESRVVCNADRRQNVIDRLAEQGMEAAPSELFCPILLNETVNRLGGEGIMYEYEFRALREGMVMDDSGRGAAGHLLHMLHQSLSQPDTRSSIERPGVVTLSFTNSPGRPFTYTVTEEEAFDIGYVSALFNYSDPAPDVYFPFDPARPTSGDEMVSFMQQLIPQRTEAELLALASQCYDAGQNHGVLVCAAAGEVFAARSFGLPSPLSPAP